MNFQTLAAIDIGTNTVRLLVVRGKDPSSAVVLGQAQRITRLGEGMGRQLLEKPMDRTVAAIADFVKQAHKHQVTRTAIFATSAARRARNGAEFCERVYMATGLQPEIISGAKEARLTVCGVLEAVSTACENSVVLDIGGGSTEFVRVREGKIVKIESLEIGAVTLSERFFHTTDPISKTDLTRFRDFTRKAIEYLEFFSEPVWVGTAGTITTLAAMDRQMVQYDPKRINGYRLSAEKISQWLEILALMPLEDRRGLTGLEPQRADIIVAGVGFLEVIMKHFQLGYIAVSDAGFREGIIYSLFD